jgi:hypothetical protein
LFHRAIIKDVASKPYSAAVVMLTSFCDVRVPASTLFVILFKELCPNAKKEMVINPT